VRVRRLLLPAALALLARHGGQALSADLELVRNGAPKAAIVVRDEPDKIALVLQMSLLDDSKTVMFAAEQLQHYVEKVSGARLPIVKESQAPADRTLVFVGRSGLARTRGVTPDGLESEGFLIRTDADSAAIVGEIAREGEWQGGLDRGTLWGVYEFLERVAGVRWYFAGELWTHIQKKKTLQVAPMTVVKAPAYRMRVGGIGNTYGAGRMEWLPAVRSLNATNFFANHSCSMWGLQYGKTHPEYFAVKPDGTRMIAAKITHRSNHLCYSEPSVLTQDIANVVANDTRGARLWGDGSINPTKWYVRFCPNDTENVFHCVCPKCRSQWRGNDPWGQHSELIFDYAARFAREIGARWPDRRLGACAYMSFQRAPRTVSIPANLDVMYCMVHSTTFLKENDAYAAELRKMREWWDLLGRDRKRFYVWDYFYYPNCFAKAPMYSPHAVSRFFRENQPLIMGAFNNGFSQKYGNQCKLTYLITWIYHKVLWDPGVKVDKLIAHFCRDMFGPAAKPMHQFFTLEIDRWEKTQWTSTSPGYGFGVTLPQIYQETYPRDVVERLEKLLAEAKAAAPAKSVHAERIEWWAEAHADFFEEARKVQKWTAASPELRLPLCRFGKPLDGNVDHPFWQDREAVSLVRWRLGETPQAATRAWLARDEEKLYVAAQLSHPAPAAAPAAATERDDPKGAEDERFGLHISSGRDYPFGLPSYYEILANPNGVLSDAVVVEPVFVGNYHHRARCDAWNAAGVECRTAKTADGWSIEIAAPYSAIPEWKDGPPRMTRIQLVRHKRGKDREDSIWWPTLAFSWEHPIDRFPVVWLE